MVDDRLQAFRRRFAEGDFTRAAAFVTELKRSEGGDQRARLAVAFRRAAEAAGEPRSGRAGMGPPFGLDKVVRRAEKTAHRASVTERSWGYTWSAVRGRDTATKTPGWKIVTAAFADTNLGVVTVAVKAALGNERIGTIWPAFRQCSSRVTPEGLVARLMAWALDDTQPDRAFFLFDDLDGLAAFARDLSVMDSKIARRAGA